MLQYVTGANIMKLTMIIIMGAILIVCFTFTIWGVLLSSRLASRYARRPVNNIQGPGNMKTKVRLGNEIRIIAIGNNSESADR